MSNLIIIILHIFYPFFKNKPQTNDYATNISYVCYLLKDFGLSSLNLIIILPIIFRLISNYYVTNITYLCINKLFKMDIGGRVR